MGRTGKYRKAYVLDPINGVVQIGYTVFYVQTGKKIDFPMKGLSRLPYVLVREKSFDGAREAWLKVWGKSKE